VGVARARLCCLRTPTARRSGLAEAFLDALAIRVCRREGAYLTDQTGMIPRFVQAEFEDRDDRERSQQQIDLIATYSAAYRRDVFLENDGFDQSFRLRV